MRWILDEGPLDFLASLGGFSRLACYPAGRLCVAPATAAAAEQSERRKQLLAAQAAEGRDLFRRFEIVVSPGDPAGELLLQLRGSERTRANLAEWEAIAWAAVHAEDAVLVTEDKRATVLALAYLGRSRVAHPFDLWIDLFEHGALSKADLESLCDRSCKKDSALRLLPNRVRRLLTAD